MDTETVKHIANLARLKLTDEEYAKYAKDMTAITDYVAQLAKVDVEGVPGTVQPVSNRNQWRDDEVRASLKREQAVSNAPEQEQNFFKVPPVIE